MTLEHVANMLGIKENSLSDKELGNRPVNTKELAKLAEIYDCEPWMLLAAPPDTSDLENLKKATALLKVMNAKQIQAWLQVGETLKGDDK